MHALVLCFKIDKANVWIFKNIYLFFLLAYFLKQKLLEAWLGRSLLQQTILGVCVF